MEIERRNIAPETLVDLEQAQAFVNGVHLREISGRKQAGIFGFPQ